VADRTVEAPTLSPQKALRLGLALLPANRQRLGVIGPATVKENVTLPTLGRYFSHGLLRPRVESRATAGMLAAFDVRPPEPDREIATLSGGNQQKALLGKWFATEPRVLMLHEPTQGVDVGARRQIFQQIRDAAERGTSFLMASTEYDDLAHLCDRVLVFRNGRVVADLHGAELTQERIVEQCFREAAR
jgi:ribose transport system ATP-binding protein